MGGTARSEASDATECTPSSSETEKANTSAGADNGAGQEPFIPDTVRVPLAACLQCSRSDCDIVGGGQGEVHDGGNARGRECHSRVLPPPSPHH